MNLTHWMMLEVLAEEVFARRWPYAKVAPFDHLNSAEDYLHSLFDVFASEDPRFWCRGLVRAPERGTFMFDGQFGEKAAARFLGMNPDTSFQRLYYRDFEGQGEARVWVRQQVLRNEGKRGSDVWADWPRVIPEMTVIDYPVV